jgi:hypothetical protein
MSFTPVNPEVYASAQAGAMAGMAGAGVLTDPSSPDYSLLAASAVAFAQEMDAVWAATPGVTLSGTVDVINGSDVLLFSLPQSLSPRDRHESDRSSRARDDGGQRNPDCAESARQRDGFDGDTLVGKLDACA